METINRKQLTDSPSARRQRGAVLLVSLIMLLIVTLLGTSSLSSVTLEERMVSNMQNANKAFEGAEAALAQCENLIRSESTSDLDVGGTLGVVDYGSTTIAADRLTDTFWASNGMTLSATNLVRSASNPEGLASEPRCFIEYVGKVSALDLDKQYEGTGSAVKLVYLNTSFSQGADTNSQAVLESLFVKQ